MIVMKPHIPTHPIDHASIAKICHLFITIDDIGLLICHTYLCSLVSTNPMRQLLVMLLLVCLMSCGEQVDPAIAALNRLEQELEIQPSEARAKAFLSEANSFVGSNYENFALIEPYLIKGAKVSKDYGFLDQTPNFLLRILRSKEFSQDKTKYMLDLGDIMINLNKVHASNVIYKELHADTKDNPEINKRYALIDSMALSKSNYVQYLFDQVTIDPDEIGINKRAALKFVDAAEALALVKPEDPLVPDYLYKAAEIARSLRTMPKAMSIYDWILEDFQDYEKIPTITFIKGFILEQEFKKPEEAKAVYNTFLERYPDHQMAESAKFLLNNLGKSDEEILEAIEAKKSNN